MMGITEDTNRRSEIKGNGDVSRHGKVLITIFSKGDKYRRKM